MAPKSTGTQADEAHGISKRKSRFWRFADSAQNEAGTRLEQKEPDACNHGERSVGKPVLRKERLSEEGNALKSWNAERRAARERSPLQ